MGVLEGLARIKKQYPQYANVDDAVLADALAKKYPDSYGALGDITRRTLAIAGTGKTYRTNMWKKAYEEAAYNPFADTSISPVQRYKNAVLQPLVFGGKALGAVGQSLEGAAAASLLEQQKGNFNPISIIPKMVRGLTLQDQPELGDVVYNAATSTGMNPNAANTLGAGLGLAGSSVLPGPDELVKASRYLRGNVMGAVDTALTATGGKVADISGAVGRIDPGVTAYGKSKNYSFVKYGQSPESIADDLITAESKARDIALGLKKKMSQDFGDVVSKYNTTKFDLTTPKGGATGAEVTKQLMDEGKIFLEELKDKAGNITGYKISPTAIGKKMEGIPDIADYIDTIYQSKGRLTGGELRTMVEGLMENYPGNPFANRLATDIRDTMGAYSDELLDATNTYARRHAILYGDKAGSTGALTVTKETPSGATAFGDILTATTKKTSQAARKRAILEGLEKEAGRTFTQELYDAVANMQLSKWQPATQLSLAGAATAAGGVAMGRPQLAISSIIAALGLSPRGIALTQKGINSVRAAAIKLRQTPVVGATMDLIDRGFIDPLTARAMAMREEDKKNLPFGR